MSETAGEPRQHAKAPVQSPDAVHPRRVSVQRKTAKAAQPETTEAPNADKLKDELKDKLGLKEPGLEDELDLGEDELVDKPTAEGLQPLLQTAAAGEGQPPAVANTDNETETHPIQVRSESYSEVRKKLVIANASSEVHKQAQE